jgi:hypothetical protein
MDAKLRDTILAGLATAAILGGIALYARVAVLESRLNQIEYEQRYFHGPAVKP